jgi:hypothetical protein
MKDAKGHGSDKRGGDYAPSASSKTPVYNPKVQGGKRMFGRQPTASEAAANSANVKAFSGFVRGLQPMTAEQQKDLLGRTTPLDSGAHSSGVQSVGHPEPAPNFRLNSYTHEIVSPSGDVAARMKLGKNSGLAVDYPAGARAAGKGSYGPQISRSGGPSIHDAVSMPDYRATKAGSNSFPAEQIGGPLHYLTGNDFAGHTVRRVKG